ncbi:uncharacterized protein LOC133515011 [Syngnathoides biaculeatus]|uniref:uncharacterized protein LOC133515011 n=1 Tax=Syngnathoides biaculeatus TaxID=300417 RepID=UPI002ADDB702|nr:uncharacterized protein LOC133515011 [Syngnathoides biaculeatus]
MGRYLSINRRTPDTNWSSYCKMKYIIILLRRHPAWAAPLHLRHRHSSEPIFRLSTFGHKTVFKNVGLGDSSSVSDRFPFDSSPKVKHLQNVRCYLASSRGAFRAQTPAGTIEPPPNCFAESSRGQSVHRWSRQVNPSSRKKGTASRAENAPEHSGRTRRRSPSRQTSGHKPGSEAKAVQSTADLQPEDSGLAIQANSGPQLFHISSLATRFGESYNYVAGHVNSVFSLGSAGVRVPEKGGSAHGRAKRKMQSNHAARPKDAETSPFESSVERAAAEANFHKSLEETYRHFARHVNSYFGAEVTDDAPSPSPSPAQVGATPHGRGPVAPETGLFHGSRNTTHFGENHLQMSRHINQYFKAASAGEDPKEEFGFAAADGQEAISVLDCFHHPARFIPDLLGPLLRRVPLGQDRKPKAATASPEAAFGDKVFLSHQQADDLTRDLIGKLGRASSAEVLSACVEKLNEHLRRHPSRKAPAWQIASQTAFWNGLWSRTEVVLYYIFQNLQEKMAATLVRQRRAHGDNRAVQTAIREALARVGYVDPVKGRGIKVLSIDGGGTR